MRGALKRWAREYLYSDGPKVGDPTKVDPEGLSDQGIRPGSGARIAAEGMNYQLAGLADHAALTRFHGLETWTELPDTGRLSAIMRHPRSGLQYVVSENADLAHTFGGTTTQIDATGAIWSDLASVRACTAKDSDGRGRLVFFGPYASGLRARWSQAGDSYATFSTTSAALTSAVQPLGCAYDRDNDAVIVVGYRASDDTILPYRFMPDGTFSAGTSFAGTPSVAARRPMVAWGNGIALLVFNDGTDWRCYSSTDGGNVWTEVAAPVSTGVFFGIWWCDDFNVRGPRFVGVSATGGMRYSTDGAAWTIEGVSADEALCLESGSGDAFEAAVMVGCILFRLKTQRVFAHDTSRGFAAVYPLRYAADDLLFDGSRLVAIDSDSVGAVGARASGPIVTPPTVILGRYDD